MEKLSPDMEFLTSEIAWETENPHLNRRLSPLEHRMSLNSDSYLYC